jgi:hypothetical protein
MECLKGGENGVAIVCADPPISSINLHLELFCLLSEYNIIPLKGKLATIMITPQSMLPWLPQQILPESPPWHGIIIENESAFEEYRPEKCDYVFETTWVTDVGDVETIDICFVDPLLKRRVLV